jgi:hypothetical protein
MQRKTIQTLLFLLIVLGFVMAIGLPVAPTQAQGVWPPFSLTVTPTHEAGRITYKLVWQSFLPAGDIVDLDIRIPLPEGLKYVKGDASVATAVSYDGKEVRFFTSAINYSGLPTMSFEVEVTDPSKTEFVIQPWIAWKGKVPGDYLHAPVKIDLRQQNLEWARPVFPKRLLLDATALVNGDEVTYYIYPINMGGRMWDVVVTLPLPEGATFISADAPPSFPAFTHTFQNGAVTFKTSELPQFEQLQLQVKVSTKGVTSPAMVTHVWAQWRNVGLPVGYVIPPKNDLVTGDLVITPRKNGWIMADALDDVALANYDITSMGVQDEGEAFNVLFYTRDPVGPPPQPLFFMFYLNTDCTTDRQYRVLYEHLSGHALFQKFEAAIQDWGTPLPVEGSYAGPRLVTMTVPKAYLGNAAGFCAIGRVINGSQAYTTPLLFDMIPDRTDLLQIINYSVNVAFQANKDQRKGMYEGIAQALSPLTGWMTPTPAPAATAQFLDPGNMLSYVPKFDLSGNTGGEIVSSNGRGLVAQQIRELESLAKTAAQMAQMAHQAAPAAQGAGAQPSLPPAPATAIPQAVAAAPADLSGKLAIPIDNGKGAYDVQIFSISGQKKLAHIQNARQPDFNYDGQRLVFAGARLKPGEDLLYEYNMADGSQHIVSDYAGSEYPIYDPWGTKLAFANTGLTLGKAEWAYEICSSHGPRDLEEGQCQGALQLRTEGFTLEELLKIAKEAGVEVDPFPRIPDDLREHILEAIRIGINLPYRTFPRRPFMFVQCDLEPTSQKWAALPDKEKEKGPNRCLDVPGQGMLIPDVLGEIQGSYPVWTANDMIVYNGCDTWGGARLCGLFAVPSYSTKGFSDGIQPVRLTDQADDRPSDSEGNLVAFTSKRDGDWEAYIMDISARQVNNLLDKSVVKNLSQSPTSNDGIPTISPDGKWVAFVSDRSGRWAVWVVPADGSGQPTRLFDLPSDQPWAADDTRPWYTERLSWGSDGGNEPLPYQVPPTPVYSELFAPAAPPAPQPPVEQPSPQPEPPTPTPAATALPPTPTRTPLPTSLPTPTEIPR